DAAQGFGREIGLVGRAPPDVITGIDRLHLRCDLPAHAGADAVAADQYVGMLDLAAGELHAHAAPVLIDALEVMTKVVMRRVDGAAQNLLQPIPRREDLPQRPLV